MDIPNFRRGLELNSTELNKLSNAIRSAAVTSVIGGTFSRTPGGTTIMVDAQVRGGGGASVKCWFEATNASVGTALKVKIAQDQIAGRYPDGMGLGFPDFILEIFQNCYIYAKILFNTTTLEIETGSDSITVLKSNDLQENTASEQYILLATVETETGPARIVAINNVCLQPQPNPCALAWTT